MLSGMSRKGILAFSGLHVDPGYKSPTIADAIKSVETLEHMIDEVKKDVSEIRSDFKLYKNDVSWIKNILIGILIALVVGIGIAVATKFI
jgi:hypothetical protein